MTNGKWKKMMSSPHVGFATWNSDSWSYPKAKKITLSEEAKMLVSVDGDANAYETGTLSLPLFTNTGKQRYCVTLGNGGTKDYSFTAGTLADWIQITDKDGRQVVNGGTISEAAYFYISVDWTKVRSDKTGTVVIKGNDQTVKLTVQTSYTDYKNKGIGTHIESHDVVTIDGPEYVNNTGSAKGVSWECIHGYGRYSSVMKMFPVTESFTERTGNTYQVKTGSNTRTVTEYKPPAGAPYLEYRFYVDEDDDYTFTAYTTPTNNIFKPSDWGYVPVELFYGIQTDDGQIQNVNSLPDGKYISYAADGDNRWKDGIMNNIHVSVSKEHLTAGVHRVRIYGMHAGLGLQRLVISNKDIKESYLGPEKTFMLDYDVIPEQKKGIHFEAAASPLNYGNPSDITSITDPADHNDPSDPYMEETPIPGPVSTPAPSNDPESKKDLKQVVVPATLKIQGHKLKVTSIGKNAFRNCSKLKKIIFQTKQLRKPGKHAFQGISKKVSVKIPKGMGRKQTKIFRNLKFS